MNRLTWTSIAAVTIALSAGCSSLTEKQRMCLADGERAFRNKAYSQAVDRLSQFLREAGDRPEAARARYVRGMASALVGQRAQAYADLEQAARYDGDPQLTWQPDAVLGVLQFEDEKWEAASRTLDRAVGRMPTVAPKDALLFRIGLCLERTGRWSAALAPYRQIVSEFPGGVYAAVAERRVNLRADHFAIQGGVFGDGRNADRLVAELRQAGLEAHVRPEQRPEGVCQVVLVGRYGSYAEAISSLARVRGYVDSAVLWP